MQVLRKSLAGISSYLDFRFLEKAFFKLVEYENKWKVFFCLCVRFGAPRSKDNVWKAQMNYSEAQNNVLHEVQYAVPIILEELPKDFQLPDFADFCKEIPAVFSVPEIVQDLSPREINEIRSESNAFASLVDVVIYQKKVINFMRSWIIKKEFSDCEFQKTNTLGGNSFTASSSLIKTDTKYYRVKLFLNDFSSCIYTYAELVKKDSELASLQFVRIREEDSDTIVRSVFARERELLSLRKRT